MIYKYDYKIYIKYFLLFGIFGWFAENGKNIFNDKFISCNPIFKSISNMVSNKICLIPFPPSYALASIVILYIKSKVDNIYIRLVIYAILFNIIELIGGVLTEKMVCNKIGSCANGHRAWHYNDNPNILGYIDVKHTIFWVILGFIADKLIDFIEENKRKKNFNKYGILLIIIMYITFTVYKYNNINNIHYSV